MGDKNVTVVSHPLLQDRLTRLREKDASPQMFRHYLNECARILAVETTRFLPIQNRVITTPITDMDGTALAGAKPLIIPILRAGLALSQAFSELLPEADTGHIGLYRDEETKRPVQYLVKLPQQLKRPIFVVDPMLATGHSMIATIDVLVSAGADAADITACVLLAAPEGLAELRKAYPDMRVVTAAMDSHLNDHAYIVPGLGDAGDRYFGTV